MEILRRGCAVQGCEEKHAGRGYCSKHYAKFKKYGDPLFERVSRTLGYKSEQAVMHALRGYGRQVERKKYRNPFDLLVDGVHRVEVKSCRPQERPDRHGQPRWLINVQRHGQLIEDCDFYIVRLEGVPFSKAALHLLFKSPIGRHTLIFSCRSLLSTAAPHIADFHRFARGEFPALSENGA